MISLTGASGADIYTDPTVIIRYNLGTIFPAYLGNVSSVPVPNPILSIPGEGRTYWTNSYRSAK